ncbi:MAG TPA: SIMPL domain-containing protein [Kofleriaceae bacterium]|nr:SIMPL domain-containing protein [Kofleriaceae bacterium]
MIEIEKNGRLIGTVAIAIAVVAATTIAARSWERVRTKPRERDMKVTGSAKRRIVSDLIEWSAVVSAQNPDRTAAYRALHEQMARTHAFLIEKGIQEDRISISSAAVQELFDTEVVGTGEQRVERRVFKAYGIAQSITIRSTDVAKVEKVSRQITDLLEQGVSITSHAPSYLYTKLGGLKIEMLAEASKDARTRAEKMLESAGGGGIKLLRDADMGVINVNPANSTATSWEGNNDTTSLEKDIITIVHITYELQ